MSAMRYDGRVAIVTGAGNGLGKSYALLLASRGAKVVVNDLGGGFKGDGSSHKAADVVVDEIKSKGGEAVANYNSVTDGDQIVKTAIDTWGRVDIIINNAGILRDVSFAKMTDKDWELIYQVHALGSYKVAKAAWPHMRSQKYGRIVNVASAAGLYGNFGQANYSFVKMGAVGFSKTLAKEGASKNIKVNVIAPLAASRMTETVMPKEMLDNLKPEFVAPAVAYLVHEDCEPSGQIFEIGAGWIAGVRWQRAKGGILAFNEATPEGVKKVWDKVVDYETEPEYPTGTQDGMGAVMAAVQLHAEQKAKL